MARKNVQGERALEVFVNLHIYAVGKCDHGQSIYTIPDFSPREGAASHMMNGCAAHSSHRLLTHHLKTCSLVALFTSSIRSFV
jgi:hypothetical protein